ncbi:MAG: dTDP-4-dehydrorhamnose reductase [Omnitrophica WOR_2 bacterium]
MEILLIGKVGQVGWELLRTLAPLGNVTAVDYPGINLADEASTRWLVKETQPQVIVNAAAYTNVDKAESEPELAYAINGTAPGILADEARASGAALIHYSTDYVFNGELGSAYRESDPTNPINSYGKSKLAGEQAIQDAGGSYLILRTSWVYSNRQGGFVNKVLQWARQQRVLRVVTDQVSSPTWCRALAEATAQVLAMASPDPSAWIEERKGLYHLAGAGSASRWEWAKAILDFDPARQEEIMEELQPALTAEFPTPAVRPLYTPLNSELFCNTFGLRLPAWESSLRLAMDVK